MTSVNRTGDVPGIAFGHLLANIDRVIDRVGPGRSRVGWTVSGTAGGEHFSLSRNNRFADTFDISFASSDELPGQLATLVGNPFAEVAFTDLTIDAELDSSFQRYRITGLERRDGAEWIPVDPAEPLIVAPDSTLRLRALLAAHQSDAPVAPVELTFSIPEDAAGSEGSMDVIGGSTPSGEGEFAELGGEPASFEELLAALEDAPRGDDIVGELLLFGAGPAAPSPVAAVRRRVAEVVTGSLSIPVIVEGGEEPPFEEPPLEEPPFEPPPFGEPPFELPPFGEPPFGEPPTGEPRARLSVGGRSTQRLARALRRGIRVTVRSDAPGRLVLRALVSRKAARRLGIAKVVGAKTRRVPAGRTRVTLKLKRRARERLEDASRARLTIRARITTAAGTRSDRFGVVLRRSGG